MKVCNNLSLLEVTLGQNDTKNNGDFKGRTRVRNRKSNIRKTKESPTIKKLLTGLYLLVK